MQPKTIISILVTIIFFDCFAKILALNFLPFEEDVFLIKDKLSFYLTFNHGPLGGQADYMLRNETNKNLEIVLSAISGITLLIYSSIISQFHLKSGFKILFGVGLLLSTSILFGLLRPSLSEILISNWEASVISKLGGISFYLAIFIFTKDKSIKAFLLIIISAGLSNLINHFYYPYNIIDFINIEGSYDLLKIGVFNFADLIIDVGLLGLIFSILYAVIKCIKGAFMNRKLKAKEKIIALNNS